ncbi:hypothetical protein LCL97_02785 [Seohaeicola saemankumensis]|nr:hypothetical protein [Seohaeicola saemankumensis]MCA0869740.1 hypothetical protein [Seohaeicola saemankumensis]
MSAQDDLVSTFATCTGRLSALMEHQWLMDTSRADDTRDRRARMIDLLEAVTPPGQGRAVLARRIEAKFALAELLTRASFGSDRDEAERAGALVEIHVAACNSLLLG